MKFKTFLLATILVAIISCSKKDDPIIADPIIPPVTTVGDDVVTTYVNLAAGNSWTYNTTRATIMPLPTSSIDATDVLTVGDNYVDPANNKTYKTMMASTTTGFYCSMLKNNYLRVDGSSVKMTGKFNFNLGGNSVDLPVTDFVIFKENAITGTNLGMPATGSTILNVPNVPYPITVNYTIKAVAGGTSVPITSNAITYNDIKKIILYITIDANATLPTFGQLQVLQPAAQDVIVSTQYYSKNNGLIKAETAVKYTVNPAIIQLAPNFPSNGEQNVTDILFNKNF